jgi:hypothetical protein
VLEPPQRFGGGGTKGSLLVIQMGYGGTGNPSCQDLLFRFGTKSISSTCACTYVGMNGYVIDGKYDQKTGSKFKASVRRASTMFESRICGQWAGNMLLCFADSHTLNVT